MSSDFAFMRGVSKRRRFLLVLASTLAIAASISAGIFYYLLFKERESRFPILSAGIYSGFISGLNTNDYYPLIVEKLEGQNSLTIFVDAPGYTPATLLTVRNGEEHVLPLLYSTPYGDFVIAGSGEHEHYGGSVKTQAGLSLGDWTLTKLKPQVLTAEQQTDLHIRINQMMLYDDIIVRTKVLERENPLKKAQLDKLSEFLKEVRTVKTRALNKLTQAQKEEEALKLELEKKLKSVHRVSKALKAAERVTPDGRLVLSARLSLEKEAEWTRLIAQQTGTRAAGVTREGGT